MINNLLAFVISATVYRPAWPLMIAAVKRLADVPVLPVSVRWQIKVLLFPLSCVGVGYTFWHVEALMEVAKLLTQAFFVHHTRIVEFFSTASEFLELEPRSSAKVLRFAECGGTVFRFDPDALACLPRPSP